MIKKIKKFLGFKEKELKYPIPFYLVKYTDISLQNNIRDNQNKIIVHYFLNKYGNIDVKKYKYTEQMVNILNKKGIPGFDKTKTEQRFPVFLKELPGEITYTK